MSKLNKTNNIQKMKKETYSSDAPWESIIGYYRAIKFGNTVEVAGTTAVNEEGAVESHEYFDQTLFILNKIESALKHFGYNREDIIRTRIFVCDIRKWEEVAKAHLEFFQSAMPVNTLVETSGLIRDDLFVEIEAKAIK